MPRRYRPPSRRRRSKKERPQAEPTAPRDAAPAAPAAPVSPPPSPVSAPVTAREDRSDRGRQIGRDHSYVLGDLRRIALIVVFIVGGLLITAILR